MRTLMGTFLKGLLAFLPVFLTVYCAYVFGNWLNDVSNRPAYRMCRDSASCWVQLPSSRLVCSSARD
jgi:uncharacterized membrane protein